MLVKIYNTWLPFVLQSCKLLEPLIIYDPTELYGSEYLICLNGEAKYGYLQSEEDSNLALVDSTTPYFYRYERDDSVKRSFETALL